MFDGVQEAQSRTKAMMAWNASTVVLTFRGTANIGNAVSDLKVWRSVHAPRRGVFVMGSLPLVHTGFYR